MTTFAIRPYAPSDLPIVTDSFWRGFIKSPFAQGCTPAELTTMFKHLLAHPDWTTLMAEVPDVPGEVCGWLTFRTPRELAWLEVKARYRRKGCARELLGAAGVTSGEIACAFLDPKVSEAASARGLKLRFRPFIAYGRREAEARAA